MNVIESAYMLPGQVALRLHDKIVWVGPLSAPWEDVECDTIIVGK